MQQIILNIKDDLQLVSLLSLWDTLDNWCTDFEIVFVKDLDLFQNKYKNIRLFRCCLFSHSFMDSTVTPFSDRALSKFEREVLNLLNKSYSFPKGLLNNVAGNLSIMKTLN